MSLPFRSRLVALAEHRSGEIPRAVPFYYQPLPADFFRSGRKNRKEAWMGTQLWFHADVAFQAKREVEPTWT